MNKIRAIGTIALALTAVAPAFAQNADAVRNQCLQSAATYRSQSIGQCRPHPRDPRVLQACHTRANGAYERAVARCEQNYQQSLQRRR
ncbi:MAG TPA: hypothetical protein VMS43_14850 [Allosphingosinicella sp.]|nr:hypothetical protein [Allosphingosinicella sp.]